MVKLGSAVIANDAGLPDAAFLRSVCQQLASLWGLGWAPVLVSSGAKVSGEAILRDCGKPISKNSRRVLAAVGQSELISAYSQKLRSENSELLAAQILLSRQALADHCRYVEIRENLLEMLQHGIIPIINNNDSTASESISFVDNDQLAAYIAGMLNAQQVVLVTKSGGVYTQNPMLYRDASKIKILDGERTSWPDIDVDDSGSSFGGMKNKLEAVQLLSVLGIPTRIIGKDDANGIIRSISDPNGDLGTRLIPSPNIKQLDNYKRWLCTGALTRGMLILSDPGSERLTGMAGERKSISILTVGIVRHHGAFERGDTVAIRRADYSLVGIGTVRYGSKDLQRMVEERKSANIVHADHVLSADHTAFITVSDRQAILATYRRLRDMGYVVQEKQSGSGPANKGGVIRIARRRTVAIVREAADQQQKRNQDSDGIEFHEMEARALWQEARVASKTFGVGVDEWLVYRAFT